MTTIPEIEYIALGRFPIKRDFFDNNMNEHKRLAFIEGYKQAIIDNEPKFAISGDYCAVCQGTEFWNDSDEEE